MSAGLFLLTSIARAQSLHPLVSEGDAIPAIGSVQALAPPFVGVSDSGSWVLALDTDFADLTRDQLLVRDGAITLQEGTRLAEPLGAAVNQILAADTTNDGDLAAILSTRSPTTTGVYFNLHRVTALGERVAGPPFGTGTAWTRLLQVELNEADQLFVLGEVDDPSQPGPDDALVRYDLGPRGNVLDTTVLLTEGMFLPALGASVIALPAGASAHSLAVNARGDHLAIVSGLDVGIAVMLNAETVLAREETPSSVGVDWRSGAFVVARLGLNDFGDHVVSGSLEGPDASRYLIERNGQRFVRGGDVIAGFSTSPIAAGRAAPIHIANTGEVFWRAEAQSGEAAYMRDFQPVVKTGETVIDGNLVSSLPSNEHAFAVSPDGRFLLGRIQELQGVGESSVLVDFGLVVPVPGCAGNAGELTKAAGDARVGASFRLALDDGQEVGALPLVSFSSQPSVPGSDCGVLLGFGELLISPSHRLATVHLAPWDGASPATLDVAVPNDPALVDLELWVQGAFRDVSGPIFQAPRPTNGLRIQIGAP